MFADFHGVTTPTLSYFELSWDVTECRDEKRDAQVALMSIGGPLVHPWLPGMSWPLSSFVDYLGSLFTMFLVNNNQLNRLIDYL